jgi:transcriptional regulator with XRE-family HTH domain
MWSEMQDEVRDEVRKVREIPDLFDRGKRATGLLRDYQASVTELSRIRRETLEELKKKGFTQTQIAEGIGLSRGRIGQLASAGPAPERAFFGDDDLTVIVRQKKEEGLGRPAIATETVLAFSRLQALAGSYELGAKMEPVPPPGLVNLNRDNLIVFGGPRPFPMVAQIMESDPFLQFELDENDKWSVLDTQTGERRYSPRVDGENRDIAYLGRLSRPDGKGTFLVSAGIHPTGTLGGVAYLEAALADLYSEVKDKRFSVLIESEFDPETMEVIKAYKVTPVYKHPA